MYDSSSGDPRNSDQGMGMGMVLGIQSTIPTPILCPLFLVSG